MNPNNTSHPSLHHTDPYPKSGIRYILVGFLFPIVHLALMFLVQIVATVFLTLSVSSRLGSDTPQETLVKEVTEILARYSDLLSIVTGLLTVLVVVLIYLIVCARATKYALIPPSVKGYFSLRKVSVGLLLKVALLAFFFYHLVLGFLNLIGYLSPDLVESYTDATQSIDTGTEPLTLILSFVSLVIMAPLVEELIYRNMAVSHMRKGMPVVFAIVVSSVIFGIAHGNLVWILYAMGLGVLFGFLYVWSDSIFVSLTAHVIFNLIGYIYSVLGGFASDGFIRVLNIVTLVLIGLSLVGVPLMILWIYKSLGKNKEAAAPSL